MNDDEDPPEIRERLQALAASYATRLPERISEIDTAWNACAARGAEPEPWETVRRLLHAMSGSAGVFGLGELGRRARDMERTVKALIVSGDVMNAQKRNEFGACLHSFMRWAVEAHRPRISSGPKDSRQTKEMS